MYGGCTPIHRISPIYGLYPYIYIYIYIYMYTNCEAAHAPDAKGLGRRARGARRSRRGHRAAHGYIGYTTINMGYTPIYGIYPHIWDVPPYMGDAPPRMEYIPRCGIHPCVCVYHLRGRHRPGCKGPRPTSERRTSESTGPHTPALSALGLLWISWGSPLPAHKT